jgi:muconolactone D-isomerase
MEFLVEFAGEVPAGTAEARVHELERAEAAAAARFVRDGHLVRLRKPLVGGAAAVGLYRAESEAELGELMAALPLYDWMTDDQAAGAASQRPGARLLPA